MIAALHLSNPEPRVIRRAAETLRAGGVIIYPTDTIYGLGCSIAERGAIEKVYLIKKQRPDRPFSFICSDLSAISAYAHVSNAAFRIMKHLIPGPYTFILPAARMKSLPRVLVSKRKTVGIRVPDSEATLAIVRELGVPILSTSVTADDGTVLNDPADIIARFRDVVELIIDAGPLSAEPSTVLDLTAEEPVIVREGAGDTSMLRV